MTVYNTAIGARRELNGIARFAMLVLLSALASPFVATAAMPAKVPVLAVLDLVDLADNQNRDILSQFIRRKFQESGHWQVIERDSLISKAREYNMDARQPCNHFQCGFDYGNILQADFVLFGTATTVERVDAVSLKMLHVPSARIVWTTVESSRHQSGGDHIKELEALLFTIAGKLRPEQMLQSKAQSRGLLAVVDLSDNSLQARVLNERTHSQVFGSGLFDVMGQNELEELFGALGINKFAVTPSPQSMLELGEKLGASHLLYSRLTREGGEYKCHLAFFDMAKKVTILERPSPPFKDYAELFGYDKDYFVDLDKTVRNQGRKIDKTDKSGLGLWVSLGILGLGGGAAAYWAAGLDEPAPAATGPFPPCPPGLTRTPGTGNCN